MVLFRCIFCSFKVVLQHFDAVLSYFDAVLCSFKLFRCLIRSFILFVAVFMQFSAISMLYPQFYTFVAFFVQFCVKEAAKQQGDPFKIYLLAAWDSWITPPPAISGHPVRLANDWGMVKKGVRLLRVSAYCVRLLFMIFFKGCPLIAGVQINTPGISFLLAVSNVAL